MSKIRVRVLCLKNGLMCERWLVALFLEGKTSSLIRKKIINGEKLIIFQRKHDLIIDSSGKNISRF